MTTYFYPAEQPAPGSIVRGRMWTLTTDDEGYWGMAHRDEPQKREFCPNPLTALPAHGPFHVTTPTGEEYTLAIPAAPAPGTPVKGQRTGKVHETPADRAAWIGLLKSEGSVTTVDPNHKADRYEVRKDLEVDPGNLSQMYCVWDTQADSVYRVALSGWHPSDAASVAGGAPRFGPVSREYAQEMADHLNSVSP